MKIALISAQARRRAFSLVEILVVVSLLTVIMLGLLMMFNQTSRAFRNGMTQTDVLESGRAISAMLTRELEQITPANTPNTINFQAINYVNTDFLMNLPGTGAPSRTNILETFYFLSRNNQQWNATAYLVTQNPAFQMDSPYGTLYHYSASCPVSQDPNTLFAAYNGVLTNIYQPPYNPPTNAGLTRVCDGVVHFAIRAYYPSGTNYYIGTNYVGGGLIVTNLVLTNSAFVISTNISANDYAITSPPLTPIPGQVVYYQFLNNAVPGSVEFELGVLEDRTINQLSALPAAMAATIVTNQGAAAMQLFRQRVYLPNVDTTAY